MILFLPAPLGKEPRRFVFHLLPKIISASKTTLLRFFPKNSPRDFSGALPLPPSRHRHQCWTACHRLGGARETPPRSGNPPNNGAFPSSQVVNATPWRCQESTCSPPKRRQGCGRNQQPLRQARSSPATSPYTGEAKMRITKITSASKVALRSRTQFALCLGLTVLRMTAKCAGDNAT